MCGVIGIASSAPMGKCDWLASGREALRHRGPDSAGEWWSADGCVGFGHRRLSIIDLSDTAQQPMHDREGKLCIVFNGEIYNFDELRRELSAKGHAFRSSSDTEVILESYREWGTDCVTHLNGMFAFALYDGRQRQVFLARDRAGEKPLFYVHGNKSLRFASELKALLEDPTLLRRVNPQALDCYLAMGFVPGALCILEGVNKLPPGHSLLFNLQTGELKRWRYWELPPLNHAGGKGLVDEVGLLDELEKLLHGAVRRQLVADVPVGVMLSGGVDSSVVTAMAARAVRRVKTFTIRFPRHGQFDETEHARLIARHFGTDHTELEAQDSTVDLLPVLARQFDEPIVDSSMIPTYLVSRMIRQHCKVALGGDGGDELFGGYGHYNRLLWTQNHLQWVPISLRAGISKMAEAVLPVGFRGRNWLQSLNTDWQRSVPLIAAYFDPHMRRRMLPGLRQWQFVAEDIRQQRVPNAGDLLQRTTRMDFENYMAEDILVKVDRASMLNSLEVRAPFLDHRLIEFSFSKVPSFLKATASHRKVLLKRLAVRLLPSEFDQQRKQGFGIPLASWIQSGPWRKCFHDILLSENAFFNRKVVNNLLSWQEKGMANSERLFALVLFELWRKEYRVSL